MEYRTGKCSQCGAEYKIPASFAHNQARCKECGGVVHIAAAGGRPARATPADVQPSAPTATVAAEATAPPPRRESPEPALTGAPARELPPRPREPATAAPARPQTPAAPPPAPSAKPTAAPTAPPRTKRIPPLVPWLVAAAAAAAAALYYFGHTLTS